MKHKPNKPDEKKPSHISGLTRNTIIAVVIIAAGAGIHFSVNAAVDNFSSGKWAVKLPFKIAAGKEGIPQIHLKEAYRLFKKKNTLFVDARGQGEYADAHIKGAISIPAGTSQEKIAELKDVLRGKTLVTYCHGAGCHLSDKTAAALYDAGYRKIRIFFGGWNEWTGAKYPLDTYEPPEPYKRLFAAVASPERALEVSADEAKFLMDKNLVTVIDVDTQEKYLGLHIDTAMSMPVEKMDETMGIYAGLFTEKPVIIYSHGDEKKIREAAIKIYNSGARKILVFYGALEKWGKSGYPLARPGPRQ